MNMKFSTALRQQTRRRFERMESADILIGIPCFNNDSTLAHVIHTIEEGLHLYYNGHRCVVFVADGGSVDDSREEGEELEKSPWIERIISIYRGVPGKGSAVRAIFEAAELLNVKACLLFDSDLQSITPDWIKHMTDAIIREGYDFVAPYYTRYKYDGTITNNIVYNLTRALYGYRVRQPIGGDFAFSNKMIRTYLPKKAWESDVARFGIDIWLTTHAMVNKARIAQVNLGVKIHDVKDPAEALGPMFKQVVTTLLSLMEEHEQAWMSVKDSQPVPVIGPKLDIEPKPFTINVSKLITDFKIGYSNWKEIWKKIVHQDTWAIIEDLTTKEEDRFIIETEHWAKILYDLAAAYHHWRGNRNLLVSLMTPLYYARVASFVNYTLELSNEEAEGIVEEQAKVFEKMKPYLIQRWQEADKNYDL